MKLSLRPASCFFLLWAVVCVVSADAYGASSKLGGLTRPSMGRPSGSGGSISRPSLTRPSLSKPGVSRPSLSGASRPASGLPSLGKPSISRPVTRRFSETENFIAPSPRPPLVRPSTVHPAPHSRRCPAATYRTGPARLAEAIGAHRGRLLAASAPAIRTAQLRCRAFPVRGKATQAASAAGPLGRG